MSRDRLQIAVLGCGRIGNVHAQSISLSARADLVAVTDAVPEAATALAAQYNTKTADTDAIMADPAIDAVVICTPTDTHQSLIMGACEARKAILCEKPIDMSVEAIRAAKDAVANAGVPFMAGFNRRFDPNFSALEQRLRDGAIGDIETVTITSRDPSPPPLSYIESSGGLFRDMMIHDFDMARFLLDEDPVSIFAVGSCLVDPAIGAVGDADTASVIMRTESGRQVQITNSRRAVYGYDQRLEVHGSKGMLRAGNLLENSVEIASSTGFSNAPALNFFLERYEKAYRLEMESFAERVLAGDELYPSLDDGLQAQMLADAASESALRGVPKTLS